VWWQSAPLVQPLFVQDHFEILVAIPADFAKTVLLVEPPGGHLPHRSIQMQGRIALGTGAGFELAEDDLAETAPLILWVDAHALDLGALRAGAAKGSHRHNGAIPFANQEFATVVEIRCFNSIDIVILGATPQVGAGLLNDLHVHVLDGRSIGGRVLAQGEHAVFPRSSARIARAPTVAAL
jgi:hypothetical protein